LPQPHQRRGAQGLTNLRTLDLSGCGGLTSVEGLKELTNLRTLDLSGCYGLTSVEGLGELRNLRTLDLRRCKQLPADAIEGLRKELAQTQIVYP
jgi:Leucine-rich repeat (LRR) protein